jgi:lipoprotein-releasing system permease protein
MATNLKLAWRNLGRNRRRTVITCVALAVGISLCVASYGWIDGINADIIHALTRLDLGHVQVHQRDYPRKRTLKLTVPDAASIIAAARTLPQTRGVSARVYGFGLASHRTKSAGVQLVGVDPTTEPRVTELHRSVKSGRYLDREPTPWPVGRELTAEERRRDDEITRQAEQAVLAEIEGLEGGQPPGGAASRPAESWTRQLAAQIDPPPRRPPRVLLGSELARVLKAKVGDRLYLISQTVDGLSAEAPFVVAGIFRTGTSMYDRNRVYLHLRDLARFLRLGDRVHEITLLADTAEQARPLALALKRRMTKAHAAAMVRTWDEIRPDIRNILQLNRVSMVLMVAIIFLVAALGVVNTMLMAVFERTRELGMLKAIGMSGWRILWLVLVETTLLVLVASFFGVAGGLGLDLYLMVHGVNLAAVTEGFSVGGMGLSPTIHAVITAEGVLAPVIVLTVMCFLGALYPGIRAARMRPARGMREV